MKGQPQLLGSTQRSAWELHASLLLAHSTDRRLGERMRVQLCSPTPSGQLSGPLQASEGRAGGGGTEREANGSSFCRGSSAAQRGVWTWAAIVGTPGQDGEEVLGGIQVHLRGGGEEGRGQGQGQTAVSMEEAG